MNIRRMNRSLMAAAIVSTATVVASVSAHADIVQFVNDPFQSTESLGEFSGWLEYDFDAFNQRGVLTISMTNTSAPANGGYITGFLFNIPGSDASASATLDFADYPFEQTFGNGLNGQPYGWYDAGAALGGMFQGGGSPNGGIGVGETGEFGFSIFATDADSLNAADFIIGSTGRDLILRFRGFQNGGSDKVVAKIIPAPGAMALLALTGLFGRRRR